MTPPRTPDGRDVAGIAAKLTKAQADLLRASEMLVDGRVLIDALPPHGLNAHMVEMYSMARDRLTPLGLAVRAHLNPDLQE